jgi:hypothetical protein
MDELKQSIDIRVLPLTFQQSFTVVKNLGYEYLWIDSLCIIQNSTEDWLHEGARMGEIYKNALCNISAVASPNASGGLFWSRKVETLLPLAVPHFPSKDMNALVEENWWSEGIDSAPLNKRGWVLQERLLSSRILYFGNRQLFWECDRAANNEVFPKRIPSGETMIDGRDSIKELFSNFFEGHESFPIWMLLVESFFSKEIVPFDG